MRLSRSAHEPAKRTSFNAPSDRNDWVNDTVSPSKDVLPRISVPHVRSSSVEYEAPRTPRDPIGTAATKSGNRYTCVEPV
jgi:hypothetical protein